MFTFRSALHEATRRVQVENCVVIDVFGWNGGQNEFFELGANDVVGDVRRVLQNARKINRDSGREEEASRTCVEMRTVCTRCGTTAPPSFLYSMVTCVLLSGNNHSNFLLSRCSCKAFTNFYTDDD